VLAAGCDDFVRKPLKEQEIFSAMEKHLGVRYRYDEQAVQGGSTQADTAPDLSAIPDELLAQLHHAALDLDTDQCLALVPAVEAYDKVAADALRRWLDQYRFDDLLALIEKRSTTSGENG